MAIAYKKFIEAKCKQCTYDPMSGLGTWRQQTEGCTVKSCPLWEVRPCAEKVGGKGPMPAALRESLEKRKQQSENGVRAVEKTA